MGRSVLPEAFRHPRHPGANLKIHYRPPEDRTERHGRAATCKKRHRKRRGLSTLSSGTLLLEQANQRRRETRTCLFPASDRKRSFVRSRLRRRGRLLRGRKRKLSWPDWTRGSSKGKSRSAEGAGTRRFPGGSSHYAG